MPRARSEHLVVKLIADETLVYDLERHRAYCLNAAAGIIWSQCDGQTDADQMATALQRELGLPPDEDVVRLGLAGLDRAHLLVERLEPPVLSAHYTRRRFLRQAVIASAAAVLLPTVISIVAPTAAQAATCVTDCVGLPEGTPCAPTACQKICCLEICQGKGHPTCP